jgi:transposase
MIRADAIWLATEPADMRAGIDSLLARVVQVFGDAKPHHAYLFTNARGTRMKLLAHDGHGIWLACRRLNQGRFKWPAAGNPLTLTRGQFDALAMGLAWQQLADGGIIRIV